MPIYNPNQQYQQFQIAPTDIQAGASEIFQQQALADLLRKRGMDAIDPNQYTKGGGGQWGAPPQIVKVGLGQGLAQMGQAALGGYMGNKANEQQKALAQQLKQQRDQEFADYAKAGQAIPEQPMGPPTEDGQYGVQPEQQANQMAQAIRGAQSWVPELKDMGVHQFRGLLDQQNTQDLLKSIQQQQAPAAPTAAPAISASNDAPTVLSPTSSVAAPAGPLTPQEQKVFARDMAKRGDQQGVQSLATPALTPLEEFSQRQRYSPEQAQAMVASGNKTLMVLGKQILDGYQKAMLETAIKQPGRQALATQAQGAAADRQQVGIDAAANRQQAGIAAAADRQQQGLLAKMAQADLSPEAIDNAAENYRITGQLPAMGMGGLPQKAAILNRAAQQAQEAGDTAQSMSLRMMSGKANSAALNQLTKQEQMVGAFEKNALTNADLALSLASKISTTGVPIATKWVQSGQKALAGDPDVSRFHAATETFINEYAKIMSGSMGNTPVSDAARKNAHELLSTAMEPAQYAGVMALLKQEMQNRMQGFAKQKQDLVASMQSGTPPAATAATAATGPRSFASEAEAAAAGLKPGTKVIVNGVKGTWQ